MNKKARYPYATPSYIDAKDGNCPGLAQQSQVSTWRVKTWHWRGGVFTYFALSVRSRSLALSLLECSERQSLRDVVAAGVGNSSLAVASL